jgi:DNA polymerase I-like protein with 3'-5' exonuclease and polymerase domains
MQRDNVRPNNTCTGMGAQTTIKYAAIDFETTYHKGQVDIGSLGVWHYLRHPRCTIYMVSVFTEAGTFVGHPADFDFESIRDCEWISHNAAFDQEVYIRLQELELAPDWMPRKWHCSANMTAFFGASERNLADAARVHLGLDLSKDVRDAMNKKTWDDIRRDEAFHEEVKSYALRDAEVCYALWMAKKDQWPAREQELSALTMHQVRRGLPCDQDYLNTSIQNLSVAAFEAVHRLPWADGDEEKALSDILFAAECRKLGIEPPRSKAKGSLEALDWEEQHPEINWIADRRIYLRANLLRTKLLTMKDRIRDDGRIHFGVKYFGAHTGRWSGDTKLNVQGLTKETLHGANQRRVICVQDPSKKLIIADLSQIEPRVLAWVVGDWPFLEICRTQSVYEAHARLTLGWKGGVLKKENPEMYALAKARVLGLGYGSGPTTFREFAKIYGVNLTPQEAKKTVNDFRTKEYRVVDFWNQLDEDLKLSARREEDYVVPLPSGRDLVYRDCHYAKTSTGKTNVKARMSGGRWGFTWGSKIAENVIQAIARDVFCECLLRLEAAGLQSIFTVHDEVILEVDRSVTTHEVQDIIKINPDWMPDVPLDSEAEESDYYKK